jgi:hypothetical protein
MSISVKTDEAQPTNQREASKAQVVPKGAGADRQPEPSMKIENGDGKFSPKKSSPRS